MCGVFAFLDSWDMLMYMEKFEQPDESEKATEDNFLLKHARGIAASVAIATVGGAYVANELNIDKVGDGKTEISHSVGAVQNEAAVDWGQYLAPRESVPLDAFYAADEYITRYPLHTELPADLALSDKMDSDAKEIAKAHGVSDIDMLMALRWKSMDVKGQ